MTDTAYQITDRDVSDFMSLYEHRLGIKLDETAATKKLHRLLISMEEVYQPVTKEEFEALKNENGDSNDRKSKSQ